MAAQQPSSVGVQMRVTDLALHLLDPKSMEFQCGLAQQRDDLLVLRITPATQNRRIQSSGSRKEKRVQREQHARHAGSTIAFTNYGFGDSQTRAIKQPS